MCSSRSMTTLADRVDATGSDAGERARVARSRQRAGVQALAAGIVLSHGAAAGPRSSEPARAGGGGGARPRGIFSLEASDTVSLLGPQMPYLYSSE